jgi:hypothetical protein
MPLPQCSVRESLVTECEHAAILDEIARHRAAMRHTRGAGGFGPRYSVIGGDVVAAELPSVAALAERIRGEVEAFAGAPVAHFADPVRRMRVQCYEDVREGFRWHFDGHPYAAVVTLENDAGGVTELLSERVSRFVRPLFYLAYPFPQVLSLFPRKSIESKPRDVLLLRGRQSLHRGRSTRAGRRTILVFAYDVPGARQPAWRNRLAKLVNY